MLYSTQSDETLVMLTLAGEQKAYEVLVLRYERSMVAAANSILHNINLAEDAAQDAFITAWMKLNLLHEPSKYGIWAKRIAKNCAKNIAVRFRSYLSLDDLANCFPCDDEHTGSPEIACISSEERKELHESISGLPEKVKKVIQLYYFEGLSIVEIADMMSVSAGTVKRQLYDGRKRLRKELCAMNEDINDTLVQRVMKKVEELKLWKLKKNKNGFETAYKDVLKEVEELPESERKYHALADVQMLGWWWIPGRKNDALLEKICEAAMLGKNEEVMAFIIQKEDLKFWGDGRADFMLNKQIPKLEEGGFVEALGREWGELAICYFNCEKPEKCLEASQKAVSILPPTSVHYHFYLAYADMIRNINDNYSDKDLNSCRLMAGAIEIKDLSEGLCIWDDLWQSEGTLYSIHAGDHNIISNVSKCDGRLTIGGLKPGESYTGSDGAILTFAADGETVKTNCGEFTGCQLWEIRSPNYVARTWFKSGIGIIRQQVTEDGVTDTKTLKAYKIVGGSGNLPLAKGNEWEYDSDTNPQMLQQDLKHSVSYCDGTKAIITTAFSSERIKYDDSSWIDMILQIKCNYWNSTKGKCQDVSYPMERAELLAKTPLEKAHTKAACSVARRILATNSEFTPDRRAKGKWNFFNRNTFTPQGNRICINTWSRFGFELKDMEGTNDEPLLYNNIFEALQFNTGCIWSDDWKPGAKLNYNHMYFDHSLNTSITCESEPNITTKAGTFENCLKLTIETTGFTGGLSYMGGRKEYYFAKGIGIVKTVNYYADDLLKAVYELTGYKRTGEGFMPMIDGASRRYDAIGVIDGLVGSADYAFVVDDEGVCTMFADRCGIQMISDFTDYRSILGEQIEDKLWDEWKTDESYVQHGINNLNLLILYLTRFNDRFWNPARTAAWRKYRLRFLESLGGGEVPKAWLGVYSWWLFTAGGAMIGTRDEGMKEEGYEYIEKAIELYPKWLSIPEGEALELGEEFIFCGVKAVKGKEYALLPDGTKSVLNISWMFDNDIDNIYIAMTSTTSWGWLDSIRNEERFKRDVEKAKAILK